MVSRRAIATALMTELKKGHEMAWKTERVPRRVLTMVNAMGLMMALQMDPKKGYSKNGLLVHYLLMTPKRALTMANARVPRRALTMANAMGLKMAFPMEPKKGYSMHQLLMAWQTERAWRRALTMAYAMVFLIVTRTAITKAMT
jgi:hypothetical protein